MAATVDEFRKRFPEFAGVDDVLIATHMGDAALSVSAGVWGVKQDVGIYYLTAHRLALSPFGRAAKLVGEDGKTTYGAHLEELKRQVSVGYRSL
jgi:hypothetical protein